MNNYVTVTNGAAFGFPEMFEVEGSQTIGVQDHEILTNVIGCRTATGQMVHIRCCGSIKPGTTITAVKWVPAKNWLRNDTDWLCRNCTSEERILFALELLDGFIRNAEKNGLI